MKTKLFHLDDFTESIISVSEYKNNIHDKVDINYTKMKEAVKNIIKGELTQRQRVCILMYYGESMKMKDIASNLGIGISSVSRHIKKAKNRIKKTIEYYF